MSKVIDNTPCTVQMMDLAAYTGESVGDYLDYSKQVRNFALFKGGPKSSEPVLRNINSQAKTALDSQRSKQKEDLER